MPRYLRKLDDLNAAGIERISSGELGRQMGLTPSQIRQDFSCFGEFGQQGYGYNVVALRGEVAKILGMNRNYSAVLVGVGNIGRALVENFCFEQYGFTLKAAFDINPDLIGKEMHGIVVHDFSTLDDILADIQPDVAVLCVPKAMANDVANEICSVGVKAIWNFTNTELQVKDADPIIENIHFSDSLAGPRLLHCRKPGRGRGPRCKGQEGLTRRKGGPPLENQATDLVSADTGAARQSGARSGGRCRQPAGSAAVAQLCRQLVVCRTESCRGHGALRPRRPRWTKPCRHMITRCTALPPGAASAQSMPAAPLALKTGDCFTVLSGDAGVTIAAGTLVDVTDGAEAVSGMLHTAHRYIACEDLQATITCTQTVSLLLSAGASVTRFVDVPADAWYADYVEYAAVNGLMSGVGDRCFAPDDVLTRAMFVTVLGQLAQIDEADYPAVSFSDVVPGSWYAPFVAWAAQKDIVSGTGNGRFDPDAPITREQMASIIARYVQSTGKTLPTIADPVMFKDMDAVSGLGA